MSGPRSGRALRAPRGERMPPNADARGRECAPSRSGASVDVCVCVCVCVCVHARTRQASGGLQREYIFKMPLGRAMQGEAIENLQLIYI